MSTRNDEGGVIEEGGGKRGATLEPGMVMPIHRHKSSSETCICIRGHFCDFDRRLAENINMVQGEVALNIEKGQWHSLKCLERNGPVRGEGWGVLAVGEEESWK